MGATTFSTTAVGKDQNEAFRAAQDEARYESGHGGYTGTIAEKSSAVSLDDILAPFSAARRTEVAHAALTGAREITHDYGRGAPTPKDLREARAACRRYGYEIVVQVDGRWYEMPKKVRPAERRAVIAIERIIADKWGPAGYFEVTGKQATEAKRDLARFGHKVRGKRVYCFLGWASC